MRSGAASWLVVVGDFGRPIPRDLFGKTHDLGDGRTKFFFSKLTDFREKYITHLATHEIDKSSKSIR